MIIRNKKVIVLLCLGLSMFGLQAQDTDRIPLSLEQALSEALANNLNVQISEKQADIAWNNAHAGNAGLLPSVNVSGGASYANNSTKLVFADPNLAEISENGAVTLNYNAQLGLNYDFRGPAAIHTLDRLRAQALQADMQSQLSSENILAQVVSAYYDALRAQQDLEASLEALAVSDERLKRAQKASDYGTRNSLESLNAEVASNADKSTLLNAELGLKQAQLNLLRLLNRPLDQQLQLNAELEFDSLSLDKLLLESMSENRGLRNARLSEELSLLDFKIAQDAYWPVLSLNAAYAYSLSDQEASFISDNRNIGFNAGLNVSIPIYSGNTRKSARISAEHAMQSASLFTLEQEMQLEAEIRNRYLLYQNSLEIFQLQLTSVESARANFERSQDFFERGQLDATSFREAQLALLRAEQNLNAAGFNAKVAETELLRLSGQLLK
jgi:outer membrane protein TolC